ncbi:DUF4179 domain-containing protein [Bacillus sp. Marseille-Q3570]|uniref:DUF4179 domain-containing protein n=1 Tax=Bacillus sp. Marseille-Q3570 TaxID=2963522 RepID=UPI0021B78D1C|nr:DUF4179 domain-containing protein [Bacillus sp. Marseille-Q3570]
MDDKQIRTPESIDHYIHKGIQKGKRFKRIQRRSIVSLATSMALILLLITSVRISPAFADTIKTLPGMQVIVEMIQGDKGLEDAISNDFIHEVNEKETHEGITLSVDRIIVDQARMILFYSVETTRDHEYLRLHRINMLDGNGEEIQAGIEYGDPHESENLQENKKMNGKIVATYAEDVQVPEVVQLKLTLQDADSPSAIHTEARTLDSEWDIEIPIKKEWYADTRETIQIMETVEMEKQKIHFEKAVIDPTLIALHIKYDETNEMQLFRFDDLKLMDDTGQVWEPIQNGIISSGQDGDFTLYFQSNYFRKPEELYLSGSSIRAIDKDEQEVVVDLQDEKLTQAPSDGRIQLDQINREGMDVEFEFLIRMSEVDKENHFYDILEYKTQNQNRGASGFSNSPEDPKLLRYFLSVNNLTDSNKVVFKIIDYPYRIQDPFKIKIK